MAFSINPDVSQLNRFIRLLEDTTGDYVRQRQREYMNNLTQDVVSSMRYPAETAANTPPEPYYIRGVGTRARGGRIVYESGNLQANWEREVNASGDEIIGRVHNTTIGRHVGGGTRSYSSYVHGIPNHANIALRQAFFHHQRQWPSLFLAAQKLAGENVAVETIPPSDTPENMANDVVNRLNRF